MHARPQSAAVTPTSPEARSAGVRRALYFVLVLNALSVALKIGVGARTGALTVLGAALESALDMLSNGVGILAVSVAARAPDDDHPYGHEKFETLGTLGIVAFLAITCFELLRRSVDELSGAHAVPTAGLLDGVLLALSLGVNAFVVSYERRRGRALGSDLLLADAAHTASDILVTALALASLVLSHQGYARADAMLGILVALIIAWSGYQILRGSIPILVDARAVDADRLASIVGTIPGGDRRARCPIAPHRIGPPVRRSDDPDGGDDQCIGRARLHRRGGARDRAGARHGGSDCSHRAGLSPNLTIPSYLRSDPEPIP
jgi:cation diffusion facilitator family transporter